MLTENQRKAKSIAIKNNREIVKRILENMPQEKKEQLIKALDRNFYLTSSFVLSSRNLIVYKQGFLVVLDGTRSRFSVFVQDQDGDFVYTRKPNENKLDKLYEEWDCMNENDFDFLRG